MGSSESLSHPQNVCFAVFSVNDAGPVILYHDLDVVTEHPELILFPMSMNYITALADGHEYEEGIFHLSGGRLKEYRTLVICKRLSDFSVDDPRMQQTNYFQFVLFLPQEFMSSLPNAYVLEEKVMQFLEKYPSLQTLDADIGISSMKHYFMELLFGSGE